MVKKRLKSDDRRESILNAAMQVFAEHGYEGTKTLQIAKAAGVSEALLYRHFSSKRILYRAILRQLIESQDANFEYYGTPEGSAVGLVVFITGYLQACLQVQPGSPEALRHRFYFSSLAADHEYARLAYRRAQRVALPLVEQALKAAWKSGDLKGKPLDPLNAMAFMEHVGSMLVMTRTSGARVVGYSGDDMHLLQQVVWFCGRGLGLTDDFLTENFVPVPVSAERTREPIPPPARGAAPGLASRRRKKVTK